MAISICVWANYVEGKSKLSRKSENAVSNDRVLKFLFDDDAQHIEAVVQASMRNMSYTVKIDLNDSFGISRSSCECVMGQYQCHHVAAALLFGYKRASKTDVKCSWLRRPKDAKRGDVQTMEDLFQQRKPGYRALSRTVDDGDRKFLYEELQKLGRFTGMAWVLSPEPLTDKPLAPIIGDLLVQESFVAAECKTTWLRRALHLSPDKIVAIAEETKGQRENPVWAAVRKQRLTASNFGAVLGAVRRNSYPPSLWKRLLNPDNLDSIASVAWGINHESVAIAQYCSYGAVVAQTGIWLHESGAIGASPDGLVLEPPRHDCPVSHQDDASAVPDIIEVKCPFSARGKTILEAAHSISGFPLVNGVTGWRLSTEHSYYQQIQGQLHVMGKHCCDLIVWTDVDMEVVRIAIDPLWAENLAKLNEFYFQKLVPQMLS